MKRLLALAMSFVLFVTLVPTGLTVDGAAHAAEWHTVADHGSHSGMSDPEGDVHSAGAALCQLYCAAAAEFSTAHLDLVRVRWRWDEFLVGHGVAPYGTAPEVAERPPRLVFV